MTTRTAIVARATSTARTSLAAFLSTPTERDAFFRILSTTLGTDDLS